MSIPYRFHKGIDKHKACNLKSLYMASNSLLEHDLNALERL
jgi:hypothetical protein